MALLGGLLMSSSIYGQDVQKGAFRPASVYQRSVSEKSVLYQADASQMAERWKSNDFYFDGKSYKTGRYKSNANLCAESEEVDLSNVRQGSSLLLMLQGAFETESYYDRIEVLASLDGGKTYKTIYARTGVSQGEIADYATIGEYAGKKVKFKLNLRADDSVQGEGWSLGSFAVISEDLMNQSKSAAALRALSAPDDNFVLCSELGSINIIDVQWSDQKSGVVAFTLKDKNGKFLTSDQIAESDLKLKVNGNSVDCKTIDRGVNNRSVDVVYMIDNSGSMSPKQSLVHKSLPRLVEEIGDTYDALFALYRFGFSATCPFLMEGEDGAQLMRGKSKQFSDIWSHNEATGYYEGYYAGMIDVASQQLNYRRMSQKILIMMGDETALFEKDDTNGVDCDGNIKVESDALEALKNAGFQTFVLQEMTYENEYRDIVEQTDGCFCNVNDTDYRPIMDKIAEKLKGRIYLEFCLQNAISCQNQGFPVNLEVCGSSSETITTVDFPGEIRRSAETMALDKTGVTSKSAVEIAFEVEDVCKEIESVEVNYCYIDDAKDIIRKNVTIPANGFSYSVTIPDGLVNPNKIEYNIRVNYTDGIIAASSPISNNIYDYTWTIPVKDAESPIISDVEWTGAVKVACGEKTVTATVEDPDGFIADDENGDKKVYIFYDDYIPGKANDFVNRKQMTLNAAGKYTATLEAKIGSAQGFVYFIYAEDNDGLKGWFGNEQEYHTNLYEEIPLSDKEEPISVVNSCTTNYMSGDLLLAYYKGCNGALVEVGRNEISSSVEYEIYLAIDNLNQPDIQNGLRTTDSVYIVLRRDDYYVILDTLESYLDYLDGGIVYVCPPKGISEFLSLKDDNGDKIVNGQLIRFAPAYRSKTFTIVNDSEEETDWMVNSMKIEPAGKFTVTPSVHNTTIAYGESLSFTVNYEGDEDAEADLYIFNNTLTDPFTLHLKGETIKECTDELQEIRIFDNSTNVGIMIEGNQSMVNFDVRNQADQLRREYNGYLGHGVQTFNVPTYPTDSLLRVVLTRDGDQCEKLIYLKGQNSEDPQPVVPQNTCGGWVQLSSVNTWGTLIDVDLQELTTLKIDVLNVSGSSTGVTFGPQLMGAGTHELYLGTDQLPTSGVYFVRVQTNGDACSMTMLNVK